MTLPKEAAEWLEKHEELLPRMDAGGKVGRRHILYLEELLPERLSSLRTGFDTDSNAPIGGYAVSQTFFAIAVRALKPIEAYVLSRMCAGLKQREIAIETGIAQPNIVRMIRKSIKKMQKPIYQNHSD